MENGCGGLERRAGGDIRQEVGEDSLRKQRRHKLSIDIATDL